MRVIKKCLFITNYELDDSKGISKKIKSQVAAISELGIMTYLLSYIQINKQQIAMINGSDFYNLGSKISRLIYKNYFMYDKLVKFIKNESVDCIYIRYTQFVDLPFLRFLQKVHKYGCIIYMEIPTYPYDGEFSNNNFKYRIIKWKDKLLRRYFHYFVDKIVTFSTDMEIFGIPCINISNAVDDKKITLIKNRPLITDTINMVGVANLNFWHGYDRIIEGMKKYYDTCHDYKVKFYIVGDGNVEVYNLLDKLISLYKLQDVVLMLGSKTGKELDDIFSSSHIAIGSLGSHRKNIVETKTLKNVEYAMRGLPIVYAEKNFDFDEMDYVYKVPADESAIDIERIVDFVLNNRFDPLDIRKSVFHLTWNSQMKRVFRY